MKKDGLIKKMVDAIRDPERDFQERIFLIYSVISEIAVLVALAGDLFIGENIGEVITLVAVLVTVAVLTVWGLLKNRIRVASLTLLLGTIFLVLPALFFFGGGVKGGGVIWTIFAFMYVGLVMAGKWRKILFPMVLAVSFGLYMTEYFHPEWVRSHTREMDIIDSYVSLILVGIVCFAMTWFQNRLFKEENERAKKEAERAEELTRSQNRFFSSMSHEIRTPINSILGLNELILRDAGITDEIAKEATGIQGAGKLLLALINDILDFSKMEAGSMDIVPVDYRIGDLMSEVVNMIWLKAQEKGLRFDVIIDPKVPTVLYGDEVRIKQIIINLLNNAVKYTADGSIELRVESERQNEKTTLIMISVSDTGMGIKKESLPYLFDAFKRVDEEKNRHIEGTGLGLSIVKQFAELMGGNITVNSVYGEGSTFTVTLNQGVSDPTQIGELNIHSQQRFKKDKYDSSFKAPEAKVLIVDDNEMNLEVEKKLLTATQVTIDTVMSGKEALEKTLSTRYDVILMDHLMPVMDGIDCLRYIRSQTGGLNRTTPVVVLTANAGSDNRDLYNRAGFDGYLVKPVSGDSLEDVLMRHISKDKLIVSGKMLRMREDINTTAGYARKLPVIITSTSTCDVPGYILKKLDIPILPFMITTEEGVFKDGEQMDANELIRYMSEGRDATSSAPDVKTYTEFFAGAIKRAHHLIHISITTCMSEDYRMATEAARSFDNVTVVNSESISSATGILVLIAYKLAQQNIPVPEIVAELETVKKRLRCGFIIGTTEYMVKNGRIGSWIDSIARSLNLHPALRIKNDKSGLDGVWAGSMKRVYRKYIHRAFPVDIIPDSDVVFVTYADIPVDVLMWIKEEISKVAYFENIVFKQASAAISSNCGPGSLGIMYFVKSNKSYNIGSLVREADYTAEDDGEYELNEINAEDSADTGQPEEETVTESETAAGELPDGGSISSGEAEAEMPWYKKTDFIDGDIAIQNSGSEDAFKTVLEIFHNSAPAKAKELNGFYETKDWKNYTIKIHALKSSSKLIGAMALSEKAQALENAGKEGNTEYIKANHELFMKDYVELDGLLSDFMDDKEFGEDSADPDKPVADEYLMESVFEGLKEAADSMDCDAISEILKELEDFTIPADQKAKYDAVCECASNYDYDGMLKVLE